MTNRESLEIVVRRTRHERFRALVETDPEAWWPVVQRKAAEFSGLAPAPRIPPSQPFASIALKVETCDFRRSSCGCLTKPATCLQGGFPADVTLDDCRKCIG